MRYTLYTRPRGDSAIVPVYISRSVAGSYDNEVYARSRMGGGISQLYLDILADW